MEQIDKLMSMSDSEIEELHQKELDDLLEELYWHFDSEKKKGSRSERDIFKAVMRVYGNSESAHKDLRIKILNILIEKQVSGE